MSSDTSSSRRPFALLRSLYPRAVLMFRDDFDWRITGRWMMFSAMVGVLGALAAILFSRLVLFVSHYTLGELVGYVLPLPSGEGGAPPPFDLTGALTATRPWLFLVVPAVGGLISGWLVYTFAPETAGSGTDAVIRAFHHKEGKMRKRVPLVKTAASAVTIGTGGSAGREGPIAQIGASLGSLLADRFGLSGRGRRILLLAGVAAGVSSIFRTPLGGAFFAVEVVYHEELETEALMQAVVAGITGYSVYISFDKSSTIFATPDFAFVNPLELFLVIGLACACILIGLLYVQVMDAMRQRVFRQLSMPQYLKPALGGLLVGVIAFFFPAVLGSSYGWLQEAIYSNLPVSVMALLLLAKILATSLTVGSGGSGGVFAPSLVIGGMLGGLFGEGAQALFPALVTQPGAYVMIGMGAFFAGVANVPITTTIMISELTGRYTLLVPLIFACVLAHVAAKHWSIYEEAVATHRDSPAHRDEMTTDLLSTVRVDKVIDYPVHYHTLAPSHTLDEMLSVFTRTREVILPVLQDEKTDPPRYSGLVLLEDVQSLMKSSDAMRHLVLASDVEAPFAAVQLDDTLDRVLDVFVDTQYPELPVVSEQGQIVGFVRQSQVINEYYRAFLRVKDIEEEP